MNLGNIRKQKQQQVPYGSNSLTFKPGMLSGVLSGLQTPNTMISPGGMLNTAKSQSGLMLGSTMSRQAVKHDFTNQISKVQQSRVFNYETNGDKMQGTISGGYDIQPQYSLHSPFRNSESRKDLENQMAQTKQGDSAVRGRKLGGKESDVILSFGSQDALRSEVLSSMGSQGHEMLSTQLTSMRERSENSRENKGSAFQKRKGSSDSQRRQGRFNSQGKSEQKRGKSASNSQSRQKTTASNINRNSAPQAAALRRPNSAKNLKKVPSVTSMYGTLNQRTLVTSPTQQTLQREPSQSILPPKPKPLRNSTMAKLPLAFYQSVTSLPSNPQFTTSQNSNSTSKRAPSASSDRKHLNKGMEAQYTSSQIERVPETALSPVRKNHHQTQPTSNTKGHSGNKGISRSKRKDKQSKKLQSPTQQLDYMNLQNLSPNIGRVKPNQVIKEEHQDDKWGQKPFQTFDASQIQPHQDSHDSSLALHFQKESRKNKPFNENALSQELFKTIKQQLQVGVDDKKGNTKQLAMKKDKLLEKQPKKFNVDLMKQELAQRMEGRLLTKKVKKTSNPLEQQIKEHELQKMKKQQQREQWQKEKDERHECLEMVKEALKQPIKTNPSTSLTRKRDNSKSATRPFSAKQIQPEQLLIKMPPQNDTPPILENKYDGQIEVIDERHIKQQMPDLMKKKQREKSKRKKLNEKTEVDNQVKKDQALRVLQEQCMKKFENYKNAFKASSKNLKMKKHKGQKSHKNLEAHDKPRVNQHRSKSKRRVDDDQAFDKENRRQSLSPGKQNLNKREIRSGTKSRSDKKRRKQKGMPQQFSEEQIQTLKNNVIEMLSKAKHSEPQHQRKTSLTKKSQTLVNLHSNIRLSTESLPKNQIMITKQQLKEIFNKKKQQQPQLQENDLQSNPLRQSQPGQLERLMESSSYKHIFVSEQNPTHELSPIIQNKNQSRIDVTAENKNAHGIRRIDSLQSFKPGSMDKKVVLQSYEDLSLFKTHDKLPDDYYPSVIQKQIQPVASADGIFRSRSGSIYDQQKNQSSSKRKSSKKKDQVVSPGKQSKLHGSGSKKAKTSLNSRKGSAGYKRNQISTNKLSSADPLNLLKLRNSQTSATLRPKSAAVEKINLIEVLLQQQHKHSSDQENALYQIRSYASIFVQKYLKGYLARKLVSLQMKELKMRNHNVRQVIQSDQVPQDKVYKQDKKQSSPLRQFLPDIASQTQIKNGIAILDQQTSQNQPSLKATSLRESLNTSSKSENNFKNVIQQSQVKLSLDKKPSSSSSSIIKSLMDKSKSHSQRSSINLDQLKQKSQVQIIEEEIKEISKINQKIEFIEKPQRKLTLDDVKPIEDQKKEPFLQTLMNESFNNSTVKRNSFYKDLLQKSIKKDSNKVNNSQHILSGSQIFGTDEKDMSWQYDRKSLQDFFDHNSQILKEESKRQFIGALQDSASKSVFQSKLQQYEVYLRDMERKTLHGKNELQKLNERKMLSPASQKRKLHLEKWVSVQEDKLNKKKKWVTENMNDFISKMDKDLQITKKKIGSSRQGSFKFNSSHEWSQVDMSLGHITSSSIYSTPRILGSITGTNQQQQNAIAAFATNQLDRGVESQIKPKKLFDYQIPIKDKAKDGSEKKQDVIEKSKPFIFDDKPVISDPLDNKDILIEFKNEDSHNEFANNLLDKDDSKKESQVVKSVVSAQSINEDHEEEEGESLSKMEPPHFQQQQNQNFQLIKEQQAKYEEEEKVAPLPSPLYSTSNKKVSRSFEEPQVSLPINNFASLSAVQDYQDAFLTLKEPEQPVNIQAVQSIPDIGDLEGQTEILTDFILELLLQQLSNNLFPKRVVVSHKVQESSVPDQTPDDAHVVEEEVLDHQPQSNDLILSELNQPQAPLPKKPKVRGIKTTMRVVDSYMGQIFKKIKDNEDEFIENLSTPLNKDPLEILLHLQNAFLDNEMVNAVAFQQSVLPVDLYLDLERNKADVQGQDDQSDEELATNKSMMGEWENIHNKVIFDAINEALDNFRPYGLRGPPMPWSQQTRTLTYKNGQQVDMVLRQVRVKVMEWARTFSGALPCSELLNEYGIRGPLDEDKLNMLREERLALVLSSEIEENEMLWTDYEYEETQAKLDVADMILEFLADEAVTELNKIQQSRQQTSNIDTTSNTDTVGNTHNS